MIKRVYLLLTPRTNWHNKEYSKNYLEYIPNLAIIHRLISPSISDYNKVTVSLNIRFVS